MPHKPIMLLKKDVQFKYILDQIPYRYPAQLYEAILYIPVFYFYFSFTGKQMLETNQDSCLVYF